MVATDKTARRLEAELAQTEHERLQIILNQGLDEWLRAYLVNQLKQITAQPNDPGAIDRALKGMGKAIGGWKQARKSIATMPDEES